MRHRDRGVVGQPTVERRRRQEAEIAARRDQPRRGRALQHETGVCCGAVQRAAEVRDITGAEPAGPQESVWRVLERVDGELQIVQQCEGRARGRSVHKSGFALRAVDLGPGGGHGLGTEPAAADPQGDLPRQDHGVESSGRMSR